MNVNIAESFTHQLVRFNELEDLFVRSQGHQGKELQEREDFASVLYVTTGELANNIWVTHHLSIIQKSFKVRVALPKVTYPHRCVCKNHL